MKYLQAINQLNKINLDIKDKKILQILSNDSRVPLTRLSKKVGLSRDAVSYRIKDYEKKGLIQGYKTLVDISKLGYEAFHIFIKLNNPSEEQESKIIAKIAKLNFVRAILKFNGNFDFEIAFVASNTPELDNNLDNILNCCSNYLQDYELVILSKGFISEAFPKSFIDFKDINKITIPIYNKQNKITLDKKDMQILKIIGENASMSLVNIADKTNISPDAVSYRIKNMIKQGLILKFIPAINYASINYGMYAIMLNIDGMNENKDKTLCDFLNKDKNVIWAVKTIGKYNFLAYLLVKNIEELKETSLNIKSLFPGKINKFITLIAYEEYKYLYFPKELF